jgi:hypothetical protein
LHFQEKVLWKHHALRRHCPADGERLFPGIQAHWGLQQPNAVQAWLSRYDFSAKKSTVDFLSVTAFGKTADRINECIARNDNCICCFCDVKIFRYTSKTGIPVEHVEFIVNDFRAFHTQMDTTAADSSREDTQDPQAAF